MKSNSKTLKANSIIKSESGATRIITLLEDLGVDTIFGYPGAPIVSLYNALKDSKIKHILARHEQGAIHSAEGYALLKSSPAVVLVTSGPGFTNTLTGLFNAFSDNTPVVLFVCQADSVGKNKFQDADVISVTKTCTKANFLLDNTSDIDKIIKSAFEEAKKVPTGPVVVAVTKRVLDSQSCEIDDFRVRKNIKVDAPHSCVLKTLEDLRKATRPLIIVGGGCKNFDNLVREFAHLTHVPIVTTLKGKGVADELSLGIIGSNFSSDLNYEIKKADVVLALGVRFSSRTTCDVDNFLPKSKIISINCSYNTSDNVKFEREITGEIDIVLRHIIEVIKTHNKPFNINYHWIENLASCSEQIYNYNKFNSEYVLSELYNATKKYHPVVVTDVGEHQISVSKIFKFASSKHFITSGGFGTMGFGLPASIGAYLADSNSFVLNITGDGSFQMSMQELGTCMQYNIPLKIIIMNNSSLGMIKNLQLEKYGVSYESDMINPDFVKIATSYGISAYKITNKTELSEAINKLFNYKKTMLLDMRVSD